MPDAREPGILAHLRRHYAGVLLADETATSCRFVIDPVCGSLVLACPGAALDAEGPVLLVPDEAPDAAHLLLSLRATDPRTDAGCDRWRIYHGRPEHPAYARARVVAVRIGARVVDGAELAFINPLHAEEPAICRALNADPDLLRRLCERAGGKASEHAVLVGVDPAGVDVRRRFDVLRVEFRGEGHGAGASLHAGPPGGGTLARVESALRRLLEEGDGP